MKMTGTMMKQHCNSKYCMRQNIVGTYSQLLDTSNTLVIDKEDVLLDPPVWLKGRRPKLVELERHEFRELLRAIDMPSVDIRNPVLIQELEGYGAITRGQRRVLRDWNQVGRPEEKPVDYVLWARRTVRDVDQWPGTIVDIRLFLLVLDKSLPSLRKDNKGIKQA